MCIRDSGRGGIGVVRVSGADLSELVRRLFQRDLTPVSYTHLDVYKRQVVDTAEGRLRALGTRFTVRQEAGATLLAVYQGAVEIRTTGNAPAVVITAGHQARYTAPVSYTHLDVYKRQHLPPPPALCLAE